MLPAAAQKALTPKRKKQGLYALIAVVLYSLLGFLAAPHLVEKLLKDFVADKLKLEASVGKVELNPWNLAVKLDGLSIKDPKAGETLVAAKSIYVNIDVFSSIWLRGAGIGELDLRDPYVNTHISKQGDLNLLKLIPPEEPDSGETRWRIGKLGIHQGRIEVKDESRPTPFETVFTPLNIALENLSSQPDKNGGYQLAAETGEGEKLRWHGSLALKPLRSQGHLEIEDLQATTPWRYVQDQVPVIVKGGRVFIGGDYSLLVDKAVEFKLDKGQVGVKDLHIEQKGTRPLLFSLKALDLKGLKLDWPLSTAQLDGLSFNDFAIQGAPETLALMQFGTLGLQQISWQAKTQEGSLKQVQLDKLALRDDKAQSLLDLPSTTLNDIKASVAQRGLHISRIGLKDGQANVQLLPNNQVNWQQSMLALAKRFEAMAPPAEKTETAPAQPWKVTLGELDLAQFRVDAEDQRFRPAVKIPVQGINMRIHPGASADAPHTLEGDLALGFGGKLALKGSLIESPLSVNTTLALQGLNLPPLAPYFADMGRFELESGALDVNGKLQFRQGDKPQASFDGQIAVNRFAANDLDMNERFLAWKQLSANGVKWQLSPMRASIREVRAEQPFTRVIITPDYTLNLQHIFAPAKTNTVDSKPVQTTVKSGDVVPVKVDRVLVSNGSMLFADLTLKPQFATGIQDLKGDIRNISTAPGSHAKIDLNGRVDQYGKALIAGELNPMKGDSFTDIKVKFDNVELTTLTPYSAKFAGYRIDKGKLSLDLNYKIKDRKLEATNKVVFNQLTLGDKVDSPDAVSLPLKLAVAILKDGNGVIDIDLPVSGSLDDPKFRVGPIVWKAFLNVLTKVATAPFKFIAGLVGGGDDMDSIAFDAGQSTLAPEQADKLNKIAAALKQRPNLRLELRGAYDKRADELALKTVKFDAVYSKRLGDSAKERKVLEAMFKEKLGSEALAQQRVLNLKPPADNDTNPKETLAMSEKTYIKGLRDELIAREVVLDGEMRQLALDRARLLRTQLVEQNQLEDARVFVLEPEMVTAVDGHVICKVGLTAG